MKSISKLILFLVVLGFSSLAQAEEKESILVQDAVTANLEDGFSETLTEVIASEVEKLGRYSVMTSRMIEALVGLEAEKDLLGCDDVSCMAEISGALGSKYYLTSSVAKMGKNYVISMQLVNVEEVTVLQQIAQTIEAPVELLTAVLAFNVKKLFVTIQPELEPEVLAAEKELSKRIKAAKSSTRHLQKAAIVIGSLGGAAAVTGGVFTALAFNNQKQLQTTSRQVEAAENYDLMRRNEKVAYSLLGSGGALVVSAIIMGAVYEGRMKAARKAEAAAAPAPAPQAFIVPQMQKDQFGATLAVVW